MWFGGFVCLGLGWLGALVLLWVLVVHWFGVWFLLGLWFSVAGDLSRFGAVIVCVMVIVVFCGYWLLYLLIVCLRLGSSLIVLFCLILFYVWL